MSVKTHTGFVVPGGRLESWSHGIFVLTCLFTCLRKKEVQERFIPEWLSKERFVEWKFLWHFSKWLKTPMVAAVDPGS